MSGQWRQLKERRWRKFIPIKYIFLKQIIKEGSLWSLRRERREVVFLRNTPKHMVASSLQGTQPWFISIFFWVYSIVREILRLVFFARNRFLTRFGPKIPKKCPEIPKNLSLFRIRLMKHLLLVKR